MKGWATSLALLGYLAACVVGNEVNLVNFKTTIAAETKLTVIRNKMTTTGNDVLACTVRSHGVAQQILTYL